MARGALQPLEHIAAKPAVENASQPAPWTYERLKEAVHGQPLPLVLVDLARFDANVRYFAELAGRSGKRVRVASKSLRVPALLERVFAVGGSTFRGLMCYSAAEAAYLAQSGFDELLVAYPTVQPSDVAAVASAVATGKSITLMIDSGDQAALLDHQWRELGMESPLRVCVDVDVSWRPLQMHIGAQRSPIRTTADLQRLLDELKSKPALRVVGAMAYEAQIAGVPDANPATPARNRLMQLMKRYSRPDVRRKRQLVKTMLQEHGCELEFFNGGGTGSFRTALDEPWLTEVTIGSGLLQPTLFDYYLGTGCQPAFCFALPVTRMPQYDRVTCQGGGFIASGVVGPDRSPVAIFPPGLQADPREGFGEVQTPLVVPPTLQGRISLGDPIFFRPAKAGEIAERFSTYQLLDGTRIVGEVPTYRGLGQCFH